ncbi:GspE/PulE family protein [Litorimonas sp.]|jgi:general secretion pathway protein E|uniref:GspE/PulE family protein n=1 Tax=Litorimonas sp. TaxID=1892381 RepID=UPI003A884E3B
MKMISDILKERGLVTEKDLRQARILNEDVGGLVGQALLRLGAVSEEDLLQAQSDQLGLETLSFEEVPFETESYQRALTALRLKANWAKTRRCAVWQYVEDGPVYLIAQDITNNEIREAIETRCGEKNLDLLCFIASNHTVDTAITYLVQTDENDEMMGVSDDDTQRLKEMAEEAPVIDFVNRIFSMALKENASDIHIEPFEHRFQIRYRIDGVLHTRQTESRGQFDAVVSRIKLLSGMDIAERRLPQDGRQSVRFAGEEIDLRVSSLPGSWGESMVMRLLRKENELPDLESLGLDGHSRTIMRELLGHSNGIILVTGPTGSGKSTTLYRSLQGLNDGLRKIITIEDPVEYDMDGVVQIQTNANIGYTFAKGLRSILRQDPDVIMVGEIRDGETASIAAQAALTGHLVLSTLHTNSALAAVARLVDIGLEPYMIASAVRGFAAQRLLRKLCTSCSVPIKSEEGEDAVWNMVKSGAIPKGALKNKSAWRAPVGCELCSNTGYLGRIAIFEAAKVNQKISEAIMKNESLPRLVKAAREQGFMTLMEDGIIKARNGLTTLDEVYRICGQESPDGLIIEEET